jgi:hypothetical protein
MSDLRFYLGTHRPNWLWTVTDVPLFISHRVLRDRKRTFPRATTSWALDSGGFTELNLYGEWRTTPEEYVACVRRYRDELGQMEWASPQDWMCEPWVIAKTGLTVEEHQKRTTENYLHLRDLAPDLPFIPVLQGWDLVDYQRHADDYADAGVDLAGLPLVGIGSVCRRQATGAIAGVFDSLMSRGLSMHGFGVKSAGLGQYADALTSADSLAWSFGARRADPGMTRTCGKRSCQNCLHAALEWRERVLRTLDGRQYAFSWGAA